MSTLVRNCVPQNAYSNFPSFLESFLKEGRFPQETFASAFEQSLPPVNVKESEVGFKIELAAPGLKKEDFKVNVVENTLTISAEKTERHSEVKNEENNEKYTRKEFSYSSFKRSFTLPKTVDGEQISATYSDGILSLEIPKKEEAKPKEPRSIEIA